MFFEDCGEDSVGREVCDDDNYALGLRKKHSSFGLGFLSFLLLE